MAAGSVYRKIKTYQVLSGFWNGANETHSWRVESEHETRAEAMREADAAIEESPGLPCAVVEVVSQVVHRYMPE